MIRERKYNAMTTISIIMSLIVIVEFFIIIRSIFIIKKENIYLKGQVKNLVDINKELDLKYKEISKRIESILEPKDSPPGIPAGWKIYRYFDYGFQIAYPRDYKLITNIENQDGSRGMKIYSEDQSVFVDVRMIKCDGYNDIKDYVINTYEYKVYPKSKVGVNNQEYDLYKLQGSKHYYIFLVNKKYILEINSPSEELLVNIIKTIKFI